MRKKVSKKKKQTIKIEENKLIIGSTFGGYARHPWDQLPYCSCGRKPKIVGKDNKTIESGTPYKIICLSCKKESITSDKIAEVIDDWKKL